MTTSSNNKKIIVKSLTRRNINNLFLLIHTMTITEYDYILQAQYFHTFINDLENINNARFVGRRFSFRLHPTFKRNRNKFNLHKLHTTTNLRTLMKRNSSNISHHLRTIYIGGAQNNVVLNTQASPKIDNVRCQPTPATSPDIIPPTIIEKKTEDTNNNKSPEQLMPDSTPSQTLTWLTRNRFTKYLDIFASFSGADMLRMSKEDLIQICGQADGIRLFNAVHLKTIAPKLKIYICRDNTSVFNAIFLSSYSNIELLQKLSVLIGINQEQIRDIYMEGPQSIHIQLNNDVIRHIKEETMFSLEVLQENGSYVFLLKRTVK